MKLRTFTFAALVISTFSLAAQRSVILRCESDGGMRECRFDGPADVDLSRQISKSACVEGRSWGVNGNRIWVDRGCRADFTITQRGYRGGGGGGRETILCESSDGHREFCRADTSNGVRLERQLSRTDCVEGRNWGFNNNGIWVDNGCRAEFTLGRRGGGGGYRRDQNRAELITCESDYDHTHRCSIDLRGGSVRLSRQLSRTDCIYNRTWGYNNREIWVSNGCRAEFEVGR